MAIEVNIRIIRIFAKMRAMILNNKDILLKLERIEKNMILHDGKMKKYDEDIQIIFTALKQLINRPQPPRQRIGFKP